MKKIVLATAVILGLAAVGVGVQMFLAPTLYAGCPVVQPPPPR